MNISKKFIENSTNGYNIFHVKNYSKFVEHFVDIYTNKVNSENYRYFFKL